MANLTSPGGFTYAVSADGLSYTLKAGLAGSRSHDVDLWTQSVWAQMHRMTVSLKDLCARGYAQVLKDYVDAWALAHDGALPGVDQMTAAGVVGQAQTRWPANPWTLAPMVPGAQTGDFEYVPGMGGAFTLVVHQQELPELPGVPGSGQPATYTAQ